MPLLEMKKDIEALTMQVRCHFDAPVDRVWQLWADPRQLEQWWGPPSYPATFDTHDFRTGGSVRYHMTGPEGDQSRGWWRMISVDEPKRIELEDGFADADGNPIEGGPTTVMVLTALLLFGSEATRAFVFAMVIGIVSGTYSSIFNASALLVTWHEWDERRRHARDLVPARSR